MAAVSISFLSRLAYFLPNRCPFFFLFQVVVTRGGMRRPASPCEQTAVQIRHLANCDEGERLANCDEGERRTNLEHHHQLTYESILYRHDRLSKRSQATLKPTKRGSASISPASGKRGWMAGFDCDEREERRFNLAHHHQLTYEPILQHHDQLCNRFQVTKSRFSGELRRCCRAPVGFVFLWHFTAPAGQWRRPTDPPAQCAVMIGCTGSCGDRRQQFPAAEGAVVPSRWGGRSRCRRAPRAMPRAVPLPLPPHAPTRLRESSGTHSTTHQPHLDQNS